MTITTTSTAAAAADTATGTTVFIDPFRPVSCPCGAGGGESVESVAETAEEEAVRMEAAAQREGRVDRAGKGERVFREEGKRVEDGTGKKKKGRRGKTAYGQLPTADEDEADGEQAV